MREQVRKVRNSSSHFSFKMQRMGAVRNVATHRCRAVLKMVPAIPPVSNEGPAEFLIGNREYGLPRHPQAFKWSRCLF